MQLLSVCLMGVYLQDECLVLISPVRTKVTLSLSSESFWTSLLWCVHGLFFWYNAKYPVGTLVVTKGTEGVWGINPVHMAKTVKLPH